MAAQQEVLAAIAALYGPGDASVKAAANDLLTRFAATPEAWQVGTSLLDHASVEARYFSANMLLSKVRTEWHSLTPEMQTALSQESGRCLFALARQPGAPWVVINRLCLLMAAMACRAAESSHQSALTTRTLVESVLQTAAGAVEGNPIAAVQISVVLGLLQALIEEVEQLDRNRQLAAHNCMAERTPDVLRMVEAVLSGQLGGGPSDRLKSLALHLLHSWLKDQEGVSRGLSPGLLARSYGNLYQHVLSNLALPENAAFEAAVEVVVDVVCMDQTTVQDSSWEERAVRMILAVIAAQRGRLHQGLKEDGECQLALGLCKVAQAVAEQYVELMAEAAKGCPEAVPVAEAMLTCLDLGGRGVVEIALDYFSMLNMVPVVERWPALQAPLYDQLLQGLLKQSKYPDDFTTWQESSDDADAFFRFRELFAAEILDTCYAAMGPSYLPKIDEHLKSARSWQAVEVGLFALRCIAPTVKQRYLQLNGIHQPHSPQALGRAAVDAFFTPFFAHVTRDDFLSHPLVGSAAATLVGSFSAWINQHPQTLEAVASFLLRGLRTSLQGTMPAVCKASARAFHSLCVTCTAHMSQPAAVEQLIQAVEASLPHLPDGTSPATVDMDDRAAVNDGLATLIAALPFDEASRLGVRLVTPCVTSLGRLIGTEMSAGVATAFVTSLTLVAGSIKHLEFGRPNENEAQKKPCAALVQFAWPTLEAVLKAPQVQANEQVVEALSDVYTRALQSLGPEALPTEDLISHFVSIFERYQHPECVKPIITAVQSTSEAALAAQLPHFRGALEAVTGAAFGCLQRGQLAKRPEVLGALFLLASAYVPQCPSVILSSPLLPNLLQATSAVVRCQEKDSSKSTLGFLTALLEVPLKQPDQGPVLEGALHQTGQGLTAALLMAVADKLPRQLIRSLGGVLYQLVQYSPSTVGAWAASTFSDPDFLGVANGALTESDRHLVCELLQRQPPLTKRRFEALIADLASVSRREGTSDTLLAYQIS